MSNNPDTYAVYLNIKKPFDTRNQTEKDIFYNEYYRQWGTGTDLMESGLPDWLDGMDLQEFIEEMGYDYDGLILDEGATGGYGEEVVSRGLSYVVFDAAQVKNIDNENPTDDPDIRYSERYQAAEENLDILSMAVRVESGDFKANEKVYLGDVSESLAKRIEQLTGINVDGFKVAIEARQMVHIIKDHGKNGKADRSMANPSDIAKMEYTLKNYDDIMPAGRTRAYSYMVNDKNRTAQTVLYEKAIGDKSYYVVQAVPDTKARTLYIVTAFIGKSGYKKEVSQLINAKSPDATSEFGFATTSSSIISHSDENVNSKFSERDASGNILSDKQAEFFRNPKARDKDGRLLVLYYGTANAGFTVFEPSKGRYGGNWFTTSQADADTYAAITATSSLTRTRPTGGVIYVIV